jgi:HNH endonuclease
MYRKDAQIKRMLARTQVDEKTGCWLWQGPVSPEGYPRTALNLERGVYKHMNAHTALWWLVESPIPSPLQLDHLCRIKRCINPAHMEVVTGRVNTLRSNAITAINARKTHCKRGHPLSGDNLYLQGETRQCRTCKLDRQRQDRADNPDWWKPGYEASKVEIICARCGKPAMRLPRYTRPDGKTCCSRFCHEQLHHRYCKRGHLLEGDNVRWYGPDKKYRACRACNNEHTRAWRAQKAIQ